MNLLPNEQPDHLAPTLEHTSDVSSLPPKEEPIKTPQSFDSEPTQPIAVVSETNGSTDTQIKGTESIGKELSEMSCDEITNSIALLLQSDELPSQKVIERYKSAFYSKMNSYLNKVTPEQAMLYENAEIQEIRLKDLLNDFKARRQKYLEALAIEQREHLAKKKEIVVRLQGLLSSEEEFGTISKAFREIVEAWRAIGPVPPEEEKALQKEFERLSEQFYDLRQINKEFRDYDFRKNLEAKQAIIAEARKLLEESTPHQASRDLQDLHRRWRNIGPVSKEDRKSIWEEFQGLSAQINSRYQEYQSLRRNEEGGNEQIKRDIITRIAAIDTSMLTSLAAWDNAANQIKELQKQWKETGPVPRAVSNSLYVEFRALCDRFFNLRKETMQERYKLISEQMQRKLQIIDEVANIPLDTPLSKAHPKILALQEEWRGMLHIKKHQRLFERFRSACNAYYEHQNKLRSERNEENKENLAIAQKIVARAKELAAIEFPSESEREEAQTLQSEFKQLGYIHRSHHNRLNTALQESMDTFFTKFRSLHSSGDSRSTRRSNGGGRLPQVPQSLFGAEYDRAQARKLQLEQELQNVQGNKERLSVMSSAGEELLRTIERRCDRLQQKISQINEQMREIRRTHNQKTKAAQTSSLPDNCENQE